MITVWCSNPPNGRHSHTHKHSVSQADGFIATEEAEVPERVPIYSESAFCSWNKCWWNYWPEGRTKVDEAAPLSVGEMGSTAMRLSRECAAVELTERRERERDTTVRVVHRGCPSKTNRGKLDFVFVFCRTSVTLPFWDTGGTDPPINQPTTDNDRIQ